MIKRAPRSNHYTVLNTATFSLAMPAECLGVYLYLLSKPDHWSVSPVQLAKHFGANVTGVCSNANVELVRSLGADHIIDYTKEDFTENGKTYDVIVDTVGTAPFSRSKGSLRERGRLLLVLGRLPDMLQIPWISMTSSKKVIAGPAPDRAEDLRFLAELAEAGEFKPVIDRHYTFEQIAEAHSYVDTGRKKGNVIINLDHDD